MTIFAAVSIMAVAGIADAAKVCGDAPGTSPPHRRPGQPFRALWNSEWPAKCEAEHYPAFAGNLSAAFGVDTNANSSREGSTICVPSPDPKHYLGTGLYPVYLCENGYPFSEDNCRAVNGGSPQLANLTAHLAQWRKDVVHLVPDPAQQTVINLDWEKWWPTWADTTFGSADTLCPVNGTCARDQAAGKKPPHDCKYCKYYLYREVALRLARKALGPGHTPAELDAAAKCDWELASTGFLVATIRTAQELRPRATWGFWDLAPGRLAGLNDPDTLGSLAPLFDAVDAWFPSIYINSNTTNATAYVSNKLNATRALADAFPDASGAPKPIWAYTNPEPLADPSQFLSGAQFAAEYELPGKYGVAGLILYDSSTDCKSAARCAAVTKWSEAAMLPAIKSITAERNTCARARCAGHGRCVDAPAVPAPACACMSGWQGPACATPATGGAPVADARAPGADVATPIAFNFTWAENLLCHDARSKALFVSENKRGQLWRVTPTGTDGGFAQALHVGGDGAFTLFSGLAPSADPTALYALANPAGGGHCQVLHVNATRPDTVAVVATLPRKCVGGGLARHAATGMLYAASEGDFLPANGLVYQVDPASGAVREVAASKGTYANDGVYVVGDTLYVSHLGPGNEVVVYNVSDAAAVPQVAKLKITGMSFLDDFCVSPDGATLYGAGFLSDTVSRVPLHVIYGSSGSGSEVIELAATTIAKIKGPTSVRFNCFASSSSPSDGVADPNPSLFVSQGSLTNAVTKKRDKDVFEVAPRPVASARSNVSSAFFLLFEWMIDAQNFPDGACGGFHCGRYNMFVLQPLNVTRAHVAKVRAAANWGKGGGIVLAYFDTLHVPIRATPCATGHSMGDFPGKDCKACNPARCACGLPPLKRARHTGTCQFSRLLTRLLPPPARSLPARSTSNAGMGRTCKGCARCSPRPWPTSGRTARAWSAPMLVSPTTWRMRRPSTRSCRSSPTR